MELEVSLTYLLCGNRIYVVVGDTAIIKKKHVFSHNNYLQTNTNNSIIIDYNKGRMKTKYFFVPFTCVTWPRLPISWTYFTGVKHFTKLRT